MLYRIFEDIYALVDLPLAYIPRFKAVVMADVHLGFEEDMASKGVFLPRIQLKKAIEVVEKAISYVDASVLIVAGDIKHHFEKLGKKEAKDLKEFLEFTTKRFKRVIVVRGNHDTYLISISRRLGIELYDRLWLDKVLIVHGHRELADNDNPDLVIMGHEHPSIAIRDPITGYGSKFPCFLLMPLKRGGYALVLPAVGLYQSGTAVSMNVESYLSPIIRKEAVVEEAKPFVIVEREGVIELPKLKTVEDLMLSL
ncbi:MAG: metallophosphoesterase [Ignisphaera sp.]|uniref:Metallophosphoesterase n=1 Tax=Ignisphaera aggregans TaxID=334771 RepID=A0A7J3MXV3_9CREN